MKVKEKPKKVTIKKDGKPSKKHDPRKRKSQEDQEKLDRKIIGLNGSDEIFCG